ncbi:MAG: flagellar motor switch protein FliG, partial [Gemmatimonadetes bacterium]|nr:flagellar motor switch protein FliG [Gemmatimonadota bacterium]
SPFSSMSMVRTMLMEENGEGMPLLQEVAVLCVGLGQEVAAELMKHLSDYEIEEITQAIAGLKGVSKEMVDGVMESFQQHLQASEWIVMGGMDFARATLEKAVGSRKAREIIERAINRTSSGFYMLKNVAADQIAPFISHEHPQTVALILSQLDPAQASGILGNLPARMQADVAYRIATMENITPNVIKQIEESLEASLRDLIGGNQDVGGPKVIADVLNLTGSSVEKNVLDQMDGQDPQVAEAVRNLMFVFADISKLRNPELQTLLSEVDKKDLVIALKGAEKSLMERIQKNVSEEVWKELTEEMEILGPMRLSEVEEVQMRVVQQVRQFEEQGKITIVRGDSDDQFV